MARSGWSTSNFLRCASAPVTAAPLSVSVWAKTSITGVQQLLWGERNTADDTQAFLMYALAGETLIAGTFAGGSSGGAQTTASFSTNTWFNALGVYAASNDRRVYLNGANKGTDATAATPSGLNRTSIGINDAASGAAAPWAPAGTGSIAEVAMWNATLSDADAVCIARGIHPFLVRPDALVAYWDILGYNSPENNRKSNSATMAIQGALSQSAHTRVFYPAIGPQRRRLKAGSLANATSLIHMSPVFG